MLEGFAFRRVEVSTGVEIAFRIGGEGPALLLLHGYPQNHLMWARVAPVLAEHFTVVLSDLRGYGDSGKPDTDMRHTPYSFRAMAADQVRLMEALGFTRFAVAGHDRGGRVTHRMCLDHTQAVARAAVIDIAPTLTMYERTDMAFAMGYYHWFFLVQPAPFPETLLAADPAYVVRSDLIGWSRIDPAEFERVFDPACVADYQRCFSDPKTIHSTCEDYRAAASIDLEHDRADRTTGNRIQCPLLLLWGDKGLVHRSYDVLGVWQDACDGHLSGKALPCGHFVPEELPHATAGALLEFFTD